MGGVMETLWQDLKYGARALLRSPGFAAMASLTLALGIGVNTALFSLVNGLLLRHLPVSHPEELVAVGKPSRVGGVSQGTPRFDVFSLPLYRAVRERNHSFENLLASGRTGQLSMRLENEPAGSEAQHPSARMVSGNYFSVLGVRSFVGRTFNEQDDQPGATDPVVVISYDYWTRRFSRDPAAVGRRIVLNGSLFTIIGVAAPEFFGEVVGARADLWIPTSRQPLINPGRNWVDDPQTSWVLLMGRLKPGVTIDQARAEIDTLAHQAVVALPGVKLDADDLAIIAKNHVQVTASATGFSSVRARFSQPLLLLFGMVGVVLLICCANIANLLLTRASGRAKEIGIRLAVGAGRLRLIRQMLTESLLLSLLGTALGAILAAWCSSFLLGLASNSPRPIPLDVHPDLRVFGFTLGVAALTAILFGLAPALRATKVDLIGALKPTLGSTGDAGGHGGKLSAGKALVIAQVAVCLLLLSGAGLLVRSLGNLLHQDVGFDRDHLLLVDSDPFGSGFDGKRIIALSRDLSRELAQMPGVASAVAANNGLFDGSDNGSTFQIEGSQRTGRDDLQAAYDIVGADYFRAIGARILLGRGIEARDSETSPKVTVLTEGMSRFFYGNESPIGKHILIGGPPNVTAFEIVGVVNDIKQGDLAEEPARRFFIALGQQTPDVGDFGYLRFLLRTPGDPHAVANSVRALLAQRYPNLLVLENETVADLMQDSVAEERLLAQLSSLFGVLALLLAATGLYGVMSYSTSRRTNEIGVRMALGAERGDVLRMVLGASLRLLAAGVAGGLLLTVAALRVLSSRLYGLSASDPATIAAATAILALAVLLAAYLPARRATKVDPLRALRYE
jgi:predicted permease